MVPSFALGVALLAGLAAAVPALHLQVRSSSGTITALSSTVTTAFSPYTYYASAGYCSASETSNWSCGANCDANPTFKP
ncbi:uncharacterized protein LAESUDRAFT_667816, partial [Laetiporus sulphureus 93-53]